MCYNNISGRRQLVNITDFLSSTPSEDGSEEQFGHRRSQTEESNEDEPTSKRQRLARRSKHKATYDPRWTEE
jgi:hypothetical protein